ncbi:hypothetical protein [Methanoregula sp.]|uniref:hypothetical protein n=1 Tax=Methanoregula sp. TaxID=2052170 RepID=UPI0035670DE3
MILTQEQDLVLSAIFELGKGKSTSPVTIGAIHSTFSNMDVRDLVLHLGKLIEYGLIKNAQHTTEKIGNLYVITLEGIYYYNQNIGKHP